MKETELSTAELETLLKNRKAAERKQREQVKEAYVKERDQLVVTLHEEATQLALALARFKEKCHVLMEQQAEKLRTYGGIRSNSQGGFSLVNSGDDFKIVRRRDTDPTWDERAGKAVDLIKSFLGDTIKKRDVKLHDILMGFLERNQAGDLEYAKVMDLLKHEDKFNDQRWIQGLQLIKESYSHSFKSYGYEFKTKQSDGKWKLLTLNFSSL